MRVERITRRVFPKSSGENAGAQRKGEMCPGGDVVKASQTPLGEADQTGTRLMSQSLSWAECLCLPRFTC